MGAPLLHVLCAIPCHSTEKLDKSAESDVGTALIVPVDVPSLVIVICSTSIALANAPIGKLSELTVVTIAWQVLAIPVLSEPTGTVPKLANALRLPSIFAGSPAIHSADACFAPLTEALSLKDFPVVASVIVTVNRPVAAL
jgi:hypothetical protein